MSVVTNFGRTKEKWEYNVSAFCSRGGILKDSIVGTTLYRLSSIEFERLTSLCDPEEDSLDHVDSEGFRVEGIRYDL